MTRILSLKFLVAALVLSFLVGCGRPPELIGVVNPDFPAASFDLNRQKVFIATTRQATEVTGAFFTAQRAPELGLASVEVTIPPNHMPGRWSVRGSCRRTRGANSPWSIRPSLTATALLSRR